MSATVTLQPSGVSFTVETDETILSAALRNGLDVPYGCRSGCCGSCRGALLTGAVRYEHETQLCLDESQRAAGEMLLCQAHADNDVTIQVQLLTPDEDIVVKKLPCRVTEKTRLSDDVVKLLLKLPVTEPLKYRAGQYIDFLLPDGRRRTFSLASAPSQDGLFLELHIRHVEGGDFTGYVFDELEEKTILRIEGPHGSFYLREDSSRPIIYMAGGTGFAPIKAIVEHCLQRNIDRTMYIYWGVRTESDLYMKELAQDWAQNHEHIHFIPVLSEPDAAWQGKTGFVHDAIMEDFSDLSGYEVYASGPPAMVYAGQEALPKNKLSLEHYFSDAFEFQHPSKQTDDK